MDVYVLETGCRQGEVSQRCGGVPGYLRPLARLACLCPDAAFLLHTWPHVVLGNKFRCRPCPKVAKTMERVKYFPSEGFWDVRSWSGCRRVAVKGYIRTGDLNLF
jgi:hypothetical protein